MKKFLFSILLSVFLLSSLMVHASLQTYDAWVTATDIAKGGDKTYTGTIPVKYWGSLNEHGCQTFDPQWSPNAPPTEVSVIAVVEYRGFGYVSGSMSSSHGDTSVAGVSIGTFKRGANGHAVPPSNSDPKNTYEFETDPADAPWRTASMAETCSEYASGEHDWNGSATMTVEGADWMGTSTTSTGSSNTETEGESSSETQGNSDSIGSEVGTGGSNLTGTHTESESETSGTHSETSQTTSTSSSRGGSWAAVGSAEVSVSDGTGKWIISVAYQKPKGVSTSGLYGNGQHTVSAS